MKIRYIFYSLFLSFSSAAFAQSSTDANREINKIKADTTYISAESTVKDWETAYDNAKVLLTREIEDWLVEHGASDIQGAIATCEEHILEIKTTRGPLFRAFVYVKKDKLYPYTDKSKLVVVDVPKQEKINIEVEESVSSSIVELTPDENMMLDIRKFDQIQGYIRGLQERGRIKDYGKFKSLPESGTSYMFIYNTAGDIVSCIRVNEDKAQKVSTGEICDIKNDFKGCGAIWFQFK